MSSYSQFSIPEFKKKLVKQLGHEGWGVRREKKSSHMDGLWQLYQDSRGERGGGSGFAFMLKQNS